MADLAHAMTLSDHPIAFDVLYQEILATAQSLPPTVPFCEIGTRAGGSALLALTAIKDSGVPRLLITVDPYGGKPYAAQHSTLPYNNWYADTFYRSMMRELSAFCDAHGLSHTHLKITSRAFMTIYDGLSLWQDQGTLEPQFGYVYLDGEHTVAAVSAEVDWFVPRLAEGGLLVIDDTENLAGATGLLAEVLAQSTHTGNRALYRKPTTAEGHLVLTIAIGDDYQRLAAMTHPTLQAYAQKIGADFLAITAQELAVTTAHWEKFRISDLLGQYRRILYLDTDILVREDCPNLFDLVPETTLGAFNEAPFTERSRELLIDCCKAYERSLPDWDGRYFNTGVLVISQGQRHLFRKPEREIFSFYEQTYLNMMIAALKVPMTELPYTLNRMSCVDALLGEHRLASQVVHYAGAPSTAAVLALATRDLARWRTGEQFRRHIHVLVGGGLGDEIDAEPAIRYMQQHVYPDANIIISAHWPDIFSHLGLRVYQHGQAVLEDDMPYWAVQTLPPPDTLMWRTVSNLLCHTVDFCSMALLRRTLPLQDRTIQLPVRPADERHIKRLTKGLNLSRLVLVHCGYHWNSKTFPLEWWHEVVHAIARDGHTVCLIGKNDETRGVLEVVCPPGGIDLRQQLSLGQLFALIKHAGVLVSNDSAPVHIAGAFDQHIVLIPSCKHPEHVLPYRHGSVWYKAQALYQRLTLADAMTQPTLIHGSRADVAIADWSAYLPRPDDIVQATDRALGARRAA